jgi:hypothetical protein
MSTIIFVGFVIILTLYIIFTNKTPSKPYKLISESFANADTLDLSTLKTYVTDVFKAVHGKEPTNNELTYYTKFFNGVSAAKGATPQETQKSVDALKMYMTQVMTADKSSNRTGSPATSPEVSSPNFPLFTSTPSAINFNYTDVDRPMSNPTSPSAMLSQQLAKTAISTTNLPAIQSSSFAFVNDTSASNATLQDLPKRQVVTDDQLPKVITDVYTEYYSTTPSKEETDFYVKFFKGTLSTMDQIREVVSSSASSLNKIMNVAKPKDFDSMIANGTEDEVIDVFNQILERNPNEKELSYFGTFIRQSPSHLERMKIILLQSNEYKNLQNLQSNMVHGQLLGGLTNKQITVMVKSIYKDMSQTPLDDDTLRFLKKKFIEFKLDEPRFRRFIKRFVMYNTPEEETAFDAVSEPISTPTTSPFTPLTPSTPLVSSLSTSAFTPLSPPQSTVPTPSTIEQFTQQVDYKPNDFLPSSIISGNDTGINTKQMIDAIKAKAQTDFDKDNFTNTFYDQNSLESTFDGELSTKEKAMSSLIQERNRDELKTTCKRNKVFSQYHYEDMNILPSSPYSVIPDNYDNTQQTETLWNIQH